MGQSTNEERNRAVAKLGADAEARLPLWCSGLNNGAKIIAKDDAPDVREYLINLRRDLLRKVRDLDELIGRIDPTKPNA